MNRLTAKIAGALLTLVCLPSFAQTLSDPTRPPAEARLFVPGAGEIAPVSSGPQLQSVLIGSRGREVAVIDGQTLRVGEKINGATLIKISKNGVVLQHGRERQTLKLFPDPGADAKTPAHQR